MKCDLLSERNKNVFLSPIIVVMVGDIFIGALNC
jgi:hypothetical protein